jgi:hypothetical protein
MTVINLDVKVKTFATAGVVPTTTNLHAGRLAVNTADNLLFFSTGTTIVPLYTVSLTGTTGQINVDATNKAAPILSLASNAVLPGTGAITIPVGTTAQRPTASFGMLRANTTTSTVEAYDGTTWASLVTADVEITDLIQARKTTTYAMTTSYVALTFDTNDISLGSTLTHSTSSNTSRITTSVAGTFEIYYTVDIVSTAGDNITYSYMQKNGTTQIPGTVLTTTTQKDSTISRKIYVTLAANDYIELYIKGVTQQTLQIGALMSARRLT